MAANMYRVGDYVYFETSSTSPFQIRRIEELNKTPNGNVEAKVMCFYRRRDISSSLITLADKHQTLKDSYSGQDSNDGELNMSPVPSPGEEAETSEGNGKLDGLEEKQQHQLKHRELFLSRQVETLPATHIRGKCVVTLLNETESLLSYLNKDDTFFYSLVYDPQQKTLLADKGEIRVGSKYQAEITPLLKEGEVDDRKSEELEELIWQPDNGLTEIEMDQFQIVSRSIGTFARALDCSSTVRQPSLHMSAAAASRDITLFNTMDVLHNHGYDIAKAVQSLIPDGGPVLCRDEMEEWSASEANLFEEALDKYGKDFNDIRQDFLQWKSLKSIIEYYYMWKTTDRYVQQKRIKAAEAESKLKQVYIPNYNKPNPAALSNKVNGEGGQLSGRACEGCYISTSTQWYSWGPNHMQCRLCSTCWTYWKKYGGLKMPTRLDGERPAPNQRQERAAQIQTMRMQRCTIGNCGKEFKLKAHLARHLATAHGLAIRANSPRPVMKTRAAFCLITTHLTRMSRRICKDILKPRHAARCPFIPINIALIKHECQVRLVDAGKAMPSIKQKLGLTLEPVVSRLGIDVKMEKPAIFAREGGAPGSGEGDGRSSESRKVSSGHPSIMKKRGYEQSNGLDGPAAKRPLMSVFRQAGSSLRQQGARGGLVNHSSLNGRGNRMPGGGRFKTHIMSWIDAPDDVYFLATDNTRKLRKEISSHEMKRTARNPWRSLSTKSAGTSKSSDVVVLD